MNQLSILKNASMHPRGLVLLSLLIATTAIGISTLPVYAKGNPGFGPGNNPGNGHGNSGHGHPNATGQGNNQNTATSITSTQNLISSLGSMSLSQGITTSLDAKLNAAVAALSCGQTTAAKNMLNAFINEVNAQCCNANGKPLTTQQANQLITAAQQVIQQIG